MSSQAYLSSASGYLQLGMLREAAAELARIDAPLASSPEVLRLQVEIHSAVHDWRAMRRCARQIVEREPTDFQAWIHYAYATRRAISLRSARRVLQKAEIIHPAEPIIQFNLACYAAQLAKLPEAAFRLTTAIALHPDCQSLALLDPDLAPLRAHFERDLN